MKKNIPTPLKIKSVLVTGGNGFIGSNVVDNLKQKGYKVTVFDRFVSNFRHKDVSLFLGDIKDRDAVLEAVSKHDAVINLGGILGTAETINNPLSSIEVNISGAIHVFDGCKLYNKRCVQIAVGNWFMNNSYAITKNAAEKFAFMYNKEHGTKIAVVRGLNAYGEGQKHRPVRKIIPNLIIPALLHKPITIYGDGKQIMDMIYVKDVAEILARSVLLEHNTYDKAFEAGMGDNITVNDLVELTMKFTKSRSKVTHMPMRPGEPSHAIVKGDPSTLRALGYSKKNMTSLEEGIKKTIKWYKKHLVEFPWDE